MPKSKQGTFGGYPLLVIIALGLDGTIYSPISSYFSQLSKGNSEFDRALDGQQYQRMTPPNTFPYTLKEPTETQLSNITLYGQYIDYSTVTELGYVAINFNKRILFNDITDIAQETFSGFYVIDNLGQLIHQIGPIPYEDVRDDINEADILQLGNKTYRVRYTPLTSYQSWQIISLFDLDQITIETNRLNRFIYITLIVALLLMIFISWAISQSITNPIRQMISSMSEFEHGQWPPPLSTDNEDEIKDLIEGYNAMLTNTIRLTDKIIQRQQENQEIELDLVKTQLHLLEAQINPHFIHNTLNSMNYLALVKGNQELSIIIESFNKLLRMSMAIDVSFITVAQEIDNIKAYAQIQNVRFEDAFTMDYVIDQDAEISKIPKLILQPIVENAIIHGILPMGHQGHILLAISKKNNMLMISITDDGVGIAQDRLAEVVKTSKRGTVSKHIGVQNVFDRLRLYYGDNVNVTMKSQKANGTTTIIMIPYED